jgi:hypothetical protein
LWGFRKEEEEEDEHIRMAAAIFIFLTLQTSRRKKETFGEFRTYVSPIHNWWVFEMLMLD